MSHAPHGTGTAANDGGDTGSDATTPMVGEGLTIGQVLELVGIGADEFVSVLVVRSGQPKADPATGLYRPADLEELAAGLTGANLWHSLTTFRPGTTGRGTRADVARVPALWADLDVVEAAPHLKERGIPTWGLAWDLVGALSSILGVPPLYVTMTGHGLQPCYGLEPGDSTNVPAATRALRRFGLLVRHVARLHGCHVDSVWDSTRVLRAAGSVNRKDPGAPVPVVAYPGGGAPLSLSQLEDALEAYNVPQVGDESTSEPVPSGTWQWADRTCGYALGMIRGWSGDSPGQRHPWLVAQAVRLTAAHRSGCLSEAGYMFGVTELEDRMRALCQPDPFASGQERTAQAERLARVGDEVNNPDHGALAWALTWVEAMSADALAEEFRHCRDCKARRYVLELETAGGQA